ncbi:MAG TPA: PadR family transcriptional regulator [Longilinea sp.]|nr:PadR family transcriptional regulator [Longilinea sp.]
MTLEFAILGFLNYSPLSGYDLKKIFDNSVRHFWQADQSQIYRTLAKLSEQGMVTVEKVEQATRPDRKVYSITDSGRQEFRRWLTIPVAGDSPRSTPLVQVFFSGQLSDEEVLTFFEGGRAQIQALLDVYTQVPPNVEFYRQRINNRREEFFWFLTLENGIMTMQATLDWMDSVIERIKNKDYTNRLFGEGKK